MHNCDWHMERIIRQIELQSNPDSELYVQDVNMHTRKSAGHWQILLPYRKIQLNDFAETQSINWESDIYEGSPFRNHHSGSGVTNSIPIRVLMLAT